MKLLGISRSSWHYRRYGDKRHVAHPVSQAHRHQPAQLSTQEVDQIQDLLTQGWKEGKSTRAICLAATDQGHHLASARSFARIAAKMRQKAKLPAVPRSKPKITPPVVIAQGPDQAWSWDITDLPGQYMGTCFKAYVITDVYSRKIIAFSVEQREDKDKVEQLFVRAFAQAVPQLIHADNGAVMRAKNVERLFASHHIIESHSRPRVSNDNPFIESVFATMKTSNTYPGVFTDLDHARGWCQAWVEAYNTTHLHSGIGFYPPQEVYNGTWRQRKDQRQQALDNHYTQHPQRYRKPPIAPEPPTTVAINIHHATEDQLNRLTKG
ncbi:DDE-type integrase/transposase/recombinase [Trueperella pecoris]|uniref:DDE-type integrase/transposase/recombinase n=1 Tax=Trueperella pecoris TaxID=2733571 RepID=UPI001ABDAA76|nr:DDE-type integrase/transposase/recombinase [Trueperella pecoris]QTG75469.1 DDE-type integrase/transposase/recombinase [Trueperella pecoris]QTG75873.1 DDE-type integrase/transposase/recombinase [Trueperella pecoris]QTG76010.1 DDE-type integrase/transposase/recombinase [Trueperella pecoris]